MSAMIIDDSFTATSEQDMRDLARAYNVYVSACRMTEEHYGTEHVMTHKHKKAFLQNAKNALGNEFETAKRCWEMMYA